MANSKVGQYRLEFDVTGFDAPSRSHKAGLWVMPLTAPDIGEDPTGITIQLRGGGYKNLQEVADQFGGFLRRMYSLSVDCESFTLWKYVTEFQREFQTAGLAVPGVSGVGAINVANQVTYTFRHTGGGIGKLVLLETNVGGNDQLQANPNPVGTDSERLINYLISADSPMLALDNTFPLTPLKESRGENEKLWRKVYRP